MTQKRDESIPPPPPPPLETIEIEETVTMPNPDQPDVIFDVVETMPEFPGGMDSLMAYLSRTIKYPEEARENGIQGKVYAQFVVQKDGSLSDIKVIRGIGGGCDEEAVNAIKNMPNWKPGTQRGKNVNVRFILPVNFKLTEAKKKKKGRKN